MATTPVLDFLSAAHVRGRKGGKGWGAERNLNEGVEQGLLA